MSMRKHCNCALAGHRRDTYIRHHKLKNCRRKLSASIIVRLMLLLVLSLSLISLVIGCGLFQDDTETSQTEQTDASVDKPLDDGAIYSASLAGNLHYQNFILQIGRQIFFTSSDQTLVRAMADGQVQVQIMNQPVSQLTSDGEQLFYTEGRASGPLHKMDLNGSNAVRISHTQTKYNIPYDDRLYAIDLSNHESFSIKKDGTDRQILHEAMATTQILHNHHLFITFANAEHGIWHYDLETGDQRQILSQVAASLNADHDGWLYFADPTRQDHLYAVYVAALADDTVNASESQSAGQAGTGIDAAESNLEDSHSSENEVNDQSDETDTDDQAISTAARITDFGFDQPFIVSKGYLYAPNPDAQYRLYRWKLSGNEPISQADGMVVIDDAVASFALLGDFIYYQRPDSSRIYRVALDGGRPRRIT